MVYGEHCSLRPCNHAHARLQSPELSPCVSGATGPPDPLPGRQKLRRSLVRPAHAGLVAREQGHTLDGYWTVLGAHTMRSPAPRKTGNPHMCENSNEACMGHMPATLTVSTMRAVRSREGCAEGLRRTRKPTAALASDPRLTTSCATSTRHRHTSCTTPQATCQPTCCAVEDAVTFGNPRQLLCFHQAWRSRQWSCEQ